MFPKGTLANEQLDTSCWFYYCYLNIISLGSALAPLGCSWYFSHKVGGTNCDLSPPSSPPCPPLRKWIVYLGCRKNTFVWESNDYLPHAVTITVTEHLLLSRPMWAPHNQVSAAMQQRITPHKKKREREIHMFPKLFCWRRHRCVFDCKNQLPFKKWAVY